MQHESLKSSHDASAIRDAIFGCRPFLKWAGGKTQLLLDLDRYSPKNFEQYFEPFLGGGAFFFYLISVKPSQFTAVLSDDNVELVNAYKVVKDHVEELIELLKIHDSNYKKSKYSYYYALRAEIKPIKNEVERAARFITLNKTCFNGLYRVNKDGKFNVPIGKYKNPLICDSENLRRVSIALEYSKAKLVASHYRHVLEHARREDFVYLDPPYRPISSTAHFTAYTDIGFYDQDQRELYEIFKSLDKRGCKVLLSNSETSFTRELYREFSANTVDVQALRTINCKGAKRTGHRELLIRNYNIIV
jgi:DNA adenine methylase